MGLRLPVVTETEGPEGPTDPDHWDQRVAAQDAGERLDRWLSLKIPEYSRSAFRRYIEEGRITVDGQPCRPAQRLQADNLVHFEPPPAPTITPLAEDHPLDVIHQDEHILVISKEAGMIVHPAPGAAPENTLVNALLGHSGQLSSCGEEDRPGIVHRLDRETSGLMVIARTDQAHRELARQFHDREVSKEYLALSHGVPATSSGEIDLALGRSLTDPKKRVVRHDKAARASYTAWKLHSLLGPAGAETCSWIHCFPRTGRTHQIRVHLRAIGHPILCDFLYGRETSAELSSISPGSPSSLLERHALHAWKLFLHHPISQQPMNFEAPIPPDLSSWWKASRLQDKS
ncbi:MAG: RluA family pseudouridine synthase [Planctomycetota bacterium]